MSKLPVTARDIFRFGFFEGLLYWGTLAFFERSGLWNYPVKAAGDLEKMGLTKSIGSTKRARPFVCQLGFRAGDIFAAQRPISGPPLRNLRPFTNSRSQPWGSDESPVLEACGAFLYPEVAS